LELIPCGELPIIEYYVTTAAPKTNLRGYGKFFIEGYGK
jgi:hypothetical protein